MNDLITLVYTEDLENAPIIIECKNEDMECFPVVDARSAVYVATGISAQNQRKVVVCVDSGNASRSAFSGMTEAFYRKLPIALITVGKKLDYTKELNDVVAGHYIAESFEDILSLLDKEFPMHIELVEEEQKQKKIECDKLQQILSSVLSEHEYLYISQEIRNSCYQYHSKVVYGGMPDCSEGALANVLGASLAKIHKKYIGLVSETEFIHDLNTLGNTNINDRICYIIVGRKKNALLLDSAKALQFDVIATKEEQLGDNEIRKVCLSDNKTLLMLYKEE